MPMVLATSSASWSAVKRTYAFFWPSGLARTESKTATASVRNRASRTRSTRKKQRTPKPDKIKRGQKLPDEGVDSEDLDVVQLLHGGGDVALVGGEVNDERERVVVLDLLHRRLRRQRVLDDAVLVKLVAVRERLALVFRVAGEAQGLRALEVHRGTDLRQAKARCAMSAPT